MIRARAWLLLLLLVLGACSQEKAPVPAPSGSAASGSAASGSASSGSTTASATASPDAERLATPRVVRPSATACYRLPFGDLLEPRSDRRAVPCSGRHTAQTIEVGRLARLTGKASAAPLSPKVQRTLTAHCAAQLPRFVGGTDADRALSRFTVITFVPTEEQSAQGAGWYRCDLVALAGKDGLLRLPPTGQLRGVLDRSGALDTFGLCGSDAPGSRDFERVICARPHSWRAISTIRLAGDRYPGVAVVRDAGEATCRDRAREAQDFSLKFRYGWEWPTADQWRSGQHYGFCWAPS